MSKELTDSILTLIAIVGVFGNIAAFLVARIELKGQREETEKLTRLTSDLEHRVHRLAANLDQEISRLERARDLVNDVMKAAMILRHRTRSHQERLDASVKLETTWPELFALIASTKDERLKELSLLLMVNIKDKVWERMGSGENFDFDVADNLREKQFGYALNVHVRVLELLEQATTTDEK